MGEGSRSVQSLRSAPTEVAETVQEEVDVKEIKNRKNIGYYVDEFKVVVK